jgi:methionyl-tRNA formyltransferase
MKIVFFGTAKFAVKSLEELLGSAHEVVAVVTQPDRPKGRSLLMSSPPVKESAIKNGITDILQPEKLDDEFCDALKKYNADVFVVIAYGHILKKCVLDMPKYYSINIHGSLLPKYRGAGPINWAVIDGQIKTGVTAIKMNEKMDEGDIVLSKERAIGGAENSLELAIALSDLGAELLLQTLDVIEKGQDKLIKQDPQQATHARKLTKIDGLIDWGQNACSINNLIRGVVPWPGAYTFVSGKVLKIWKTEFVEGSSAVPGKVIRPDKETVLVGTARGLLKLVEVQPEGGKRMPVSAYLRGHDIPEGTILGS